MTKFDPNNVKTSAMLLNEKTVLAASAAVEALVKWEFCDCGCPQQRSPADTESVIFLRIAAFLRTELLPQNDSCQAPGNE